MTLVRRHICLLWVFVVCLIGATQLGHAVEHANETAVCQLHEHAPCQGTDPAEPAHTDHSDCPVEHTCCHGHAPVFVAFQNDRQFLPLTTLVRPPSSRDHIAIEGPTREIDYPPQLS
ncbi:MAG: hypothetical protein WA771_14375 [Chthoniobacterales bacterium]